MDLHLWKGAIVGIVLILVLIVVFVFGVASLIESIRDRDWGLMFLGIVCIGIIILPIVVGLASQAEINNTTKHSQEVRATIIEKTHKQSRFIMVNGIPITYPEQWKITLQYKETAQVIEDKELYDVSEIGDTIVVQQNIYIKENGDIYKQELELIKNKEDIK